MRIQLRSCLAVLPDGPLAHMLLPVRASDKHTPAGVPDQVQAKESSQSQLESVHVRARRWIAVPEQAGHFWDPWAEPGHVQHCLQPD